MVQKGKLEFVIDCPWDVAVLAYQGKFWNIPSPDLPDVLEVKFSDFKYHPDTGVTTFHRTGRVALNAPGFLLRMAGTSEMTLHSETTIDRKAKVLRSVGKNETFRPRMELDEVTVFQQHPEDPSKTLLTLEGTLTLNISFFGIGMLEKLVIGKYETMTKKGREVEKPQMMKVKEQYAGKEPPPCRSEIIAREEYEKEQKAAAATDEDAAAAAAAAGADSGTGEASAEAEAAAVTAEAAGAVAGAGEGAGAGDSAE